MTCKGAQMWVRNLTTRMVYVLDCLIRANDEEGFMSISLNFDYLRKNFGVSKSEFSTWYESQDGYTHMVYILKETVKVHNKQKPKIIVENIDTGYTNPSSNTLDEIDTICISWISKSDLQKLRSIPHKAYFLGQDNSLYTKKMKLEIVDPSDNVD